MVPIHTFGKEATRNLVLISNPGMHRHRMGGTQCLEMVTWSRLHSRLVSLGGHPGLSVHETQPPRVSTHLLLLENAYNSRRSTNLTAVIYLCYLTCLTGSQRCRFQRMRYGLKSNYRKTNEPTVNDSRHSTDPTNSRQQPPDCLSLRTFFIHE